MYGQQSRMKSSIALTNTPLESEPTTFLSSQTRLAASLPRDIISCNVNFFEGDLMLTCTYSPDISPAHFEKLAKGRSVFSFCPELTHLDTLGLKMTTIFRLERVTSLTVLTKDGSPHSMQIPLMVQEAAENAKFNKEKIHYYCLEGGKIHSISDLAVRKARHYSEIEQLMPYAQLEKVTQILRGEGGCPNDRAETLTSLVEHLKEEVGEVEEALKENNIAHFLEEVGDLLFNISLIGKVLEEKGDGSLRRIAEASAQKMVARHESVFAVHSRLKY